MINYVQNIRDGLTASGPGGQGRVRGERRGLHRQAERAGRLDQAAGAAGAEARRLLVTNHESFGYFADRYGFRVVGTVIPSVSTDASPSAQELARLVDRLKATGAPAIFLETGANPQLADQLAGETGIKVVTDLFTHSVTAPDGPATDYLSMMRYNVNAIVSALR